MDLLLAMAQPITGAGLVAGLETPWGTHTGAPVPEGLTLWEGPVLEQLMRNCSPWEGPTQEKFMENFSFWEGPQTGKRGEFKETNPQAERSCRNNVG